MESGTANLFMRAQARLARSVLMQESSHGKTDCMETLMRDVSNAATRQS